jgi:coenzyme F420 hydrogenase subunit beta
MRAPGYLRPVQNASLSEAQEEKISRICPGLGQSVDAAGRTDDVLWGPYIAMYTGHATDPETRFKGASGGALTAVLTHLLDSGQVEGVVQTAAALALPYANASVLSETRDEIVASAGSRYAPSAPLAGLETHLGGDKVLAFVGKPCDVAALRALSKEDPRVDRVFPVVLSFFCAGVPSQAGTEELLASMGVSPEEVRAFRYRGQGWPGRATATLTDGSERSLSYAESWGAILSHHVQHRCKICADGTGVAADIAFADAWESDAEGYPTFEERDGVSLIAVRTERGQWLLDSSVRAEAIEITPFDVSRLAAIQPGQKGRRTALLARVLALRIAGRPVPHYTGLHVAAVARFGRPGWVLRNFAGMFRRILRGQVTS